MEEFLKREESLKVVNFWIFGFLYMKKEMALTVKIINISCFIAYEAPSLSYFGYEQLRYKVSAGVKPRTFGSKRAHSML